MFYRTIIRPCPLHLLFIVNESFGGLIATSGQTGSSNTDMPVFFSDTFGVLCPGVPKPIVANRKKWIVNLFMII